ncbi:MAG: NIPSNAP family containing protein [Acidobacteria bacterium]|nr:NIPSNAP family containing protein [Acidobacteriota bacterium]
MTRRNLMAAPAVAALNTTAAAPLKPSLLTLTRFQLRNGPDNQRQRAADFLKAYVPVARRAGAGPMGVFSGTVAEDSPFLLALSSYPGLAELEAAEAKATADPEFHKAVTAWYAGGLPYMRIEVSLLRAFGGFATIAVPPTEGRKAPRLFELRVYESVNYLTLERKIQMFEQGEIDIFRRVGLLPVFFGRTLAGRNMPNLTYMVAHDDWAARERHWRAFGGDPEWKKLREQPGLSDAEIVSNISSSLLSPLPFSEIR